MDNSLMLRPSRIASLVLAFAVIGGSAATIIFNREPTVVIDKPIEAAPFSSSRSSARTSSKPAGVSASSIAKIVASSKPRSVVITMPFSPQAPHANWDQLHEESCEEMSLILVHHYLKGTTIAGPDQAEQELQHVIAWHRANGYADDVTVEELGEIARAVYGYTPRILEDVTANDIRAEIARGNPVIIPAAGRLLGNPYFSGDGPWYHMLVVKGYEGKQFITNDVGTRRGEGYRYNEETLMNAIHNWTGVKEETEKGVRRALVLLR